VNTDHQTHLLQRLDEIHRLCPDLRVGQLMATVGLLGEDATGRSLWDIEDDQLAVALEKLADDLARRTAPDSP
jgi:hypothetical protein